MADEEQNTLWLDKKNHAVVTHGKFEHDTVKQNKNSVDRQEQITFNKMARVMRSNDGAVLFLWLTLKKFTHWLRLSAAETPGRMRVPACVRWL